jgi:hypothetical protein
MTVFLCGNSHVSVLARANGQAGRADAEPSGGILVFPLGNGSFERTPFSASRDGGVTFTEPSYNANLRRFTGREAITPGPDFWVFLLGTHNARVYREQVWRTHEPAEIAQGRAVPVSRAVVTAIFDEDAKHILTFLRQVKAAGIDAAVLSAPWPRANHRCILTGTRPEVVAGIDAICRARFQTQLAEIGLDFVDAPPETRDALGLLRPEYNPPEEQHDAHHANLAYAELMMARIRNHLARRGIPLHGARDAA